MRLLAILLAAGPVLPSGGDSTPTIPDPDAIPSHDMTDSVMSAAPVAPSTTPASGSHLPRRSACTAGGILATNLAMAGWNRYVRDMDYARIDGETIWHNLAHEWVWDDDNFQVNQIGHPLQGAMYYSVARANGFGYLGGLVWTTVGSVHWEYFMETEPPAMNDLVTTRMGGAMLGEVSWRLAEDVSGESTGEPGGWARRSAAFLVNPIHGMDRLLNGYPRSPGHKPKSVPLGLRIVTGRSIAKGLVRTEGEAANDAPEAAVPLASTSLRLMRGDPFGSKAPFDHFTLSLGLSVLNNPVSNIGVRAQLWRLPELESENSRHSLHFTQNFDYIDGELYRLSASSFGAEWLGEVDLGSDWIMRARAQPIFIVLGAASTEYYVNVERDYNFGIGPGWKTGFHVAKPGFGSISAFADRYWIRTQSGAQGTEIIDLQSVEIVKNVWRRFGIGLSWSRYSRGGYYRDFPNVHVVDQEFRAIAAYSL